MLLTGGALRTGVAAQDLSRQMIFTFYKTCFTVQVYLC
jgi:hypothetical protein